LGAFSGRINIQCRLAYAFDEGKRKSHPFNPYSLQKSFRRRLFARQKKRLGFVALLEKTKNRDAVFISLKTKTLGNVFVLLYYQTRFKKENISLWEPLEKGRLN